jgi:hypothetical protein
MCSNDEYSPNLAVQRISFCRAFVALLVSLHSFESEDSKKYVIKNALSDILPRTASLEYNFSLWTNSNKVLTRISTWYFSHPNSEREIVRYKQLPSP